MRFLANVFTLLVVLCAGAAAQTPCVNCGGTVTNTGGSLTSGRSILGNGGNDVVVSSLSGVIKSTTGTPSAAAYTDIVTLWAGGSCSGFLKSDGTCSTATGTTITNTNVATNDVACWNGTGYVNCTPGQTQNVQSGTTYTLLSTDNTKVIQLTNSAAKTITVPDATTTGFGSGFFVDLCNANTGAATFNRSSTNTIDGATSTSLVAATTAAPLCFRLNSDGSNWRTTQRGASAAAGGSAIGSHYLRTSGAQALAAATTYYFIVTGFVNTTSGVTNVMPNPFTGTLDSFYCSLSVSSGSGNAADTLNMAMEYDALNNNFASGVVTAGSTASTNLSSSANFVTVTATGIGQAITAGNKVRWKIVTPAAWVGSAPTISGVTCESKVTGAS